ncbi:MAG TPA: peroxiredoxin [Candidatus Eisenbacteria bacterium]|jgi:peroxiredoxin (alkyl hydroperoxide reductase subunit C)
MPTTTMPEVGQMAPDFTLRGPGGQVVTLAEFRGRKNVVLVFYPLAFSPVCSHQLPAIQQKLPSFEALGAVVLGVSVDSHWSNTAFAQKLGLSYPLLSDFKRTASADYGVLDPERQYSGRAIFVIDRQGRVAYRTLSANPGDIPDNDRVLEALRALAEH